MAPSAARATWARIAAAAWSCADIWRWRCDGDGGSGGGFAVQWDKAETFL